MINKFIKILKTKEYILLFIIIIYILLPYKTNAATLSILPASSVHAVGDIITVKVVVNTEGESINNAESVISFPPSLLQVVSIDKNSSIFPLWVVTPSYSNDTGRFSFNGGIPSVGFIGSNGTIISINFKAIKEGAVSIPFLAGAVRKNDGLGTDILTSKKLGTIQINTAPKPKYEAPKVIKEIIPKSNIISSNKSFIPEVRLENNRNVLKFNAATLIPDVSHYTLIIDDSKLLSVKQDELVNDDFILPVQKSGDHRIIIIAYNKNEEYKENNLIFTSPLITAPVLSLSSNEIYKGEPVIVLSKTDYPNTKVNLVLELNEKEINRYTGVTNSDGYIFINVPKIQEIGLVKIWAEVKFSEDVKSDSSEKISLYVKEIEIKNRPLFAIYQLLPLVVILLLLITLIIFAFFGLSKFISSRKKIKEITENN